MIDRLLLLHSRLQVTITIVIVVGLLWAAVVAWRNRGGMQPLIGILQLLIFAQAAIGLALLGRVDLRLIALHIVYGIVAVGLLPASAFALRDRAPRVVGLSYCGLLLILLIVVIRLFETGL